MPEWLQPFAPLLIALIPSAFGIWNARRTVPPALLLKHEVDLLKAVKDAGLPSDKLEGRLRFLLDEYCPKADRSCLDQEFALAWEWRLVFGFLMVSMGAVSMLFMVANLYDQKTLTGIMYGVCTLAYGYGAFVTVFRNSLLRKTK